MVIGFIFTLFCTAAFCLGFYLVTSEDYALSFIRKFFERLDGRITIIENNAECFLVKKPGKYYWFKFLQFISPAICRCITCMSSVWGVTWFITINGLHLHEIPYLILNSFAAAFIQTFIWKLYAKTDL